MIRDQQAKSEIAQDWRAVRKLRNPVRTSVLPGFGVIVEEPVHDFYNLPLVLAYAVLDQVLNELRDQSEFRSKNSKLGTKMFASRKALPWQDYGLVDNGREARNDLAHEAKLLSKADCLRYIDAIESELRAWNIVGQDPAR